MRLTTDENALALKHSNAILDYNNLLCKMIKSSVDFNEGTFHAFSFRGSLSHPIGSFSAGLNFGYEMSSGERIGARVDLAIAAHESCVYITDDVMAGTQEISNVKTAVLINEEVYHLFEKIDLSILKIDQIMSVVSVSWHSLSTLIKAYSASQVLSYLEAGKAPANTIIQIIFGAFDGEGFIIWSNNLHSRCDIGSV